MRQIPEQDEPDEGIEDSEATDFEASSQMETGPLLSSNLQSGQQASVLNAVSDAIYKQYLRDSDPAAALNKTEDSATATAPGSTQQESSAPQEKTENWDMEDEREGAEGEEEEDVKYFQADIRVNSETNEKGLKGFYLFISRIYIVWMSDGSF